jgi:hypothetical protein
LVSSGAVLDNASFSTCYGFDGRYGAFLEYNNWADPHNVGWILAQDVPAAGVWHHFVYVYDGATCLSVYVDGALSVTRSFPSPLFTLANTSIYVGTTVDSGMSLVGYINSIRLHGGVLSPAEVLYNYLAGPSEWDNGPVAILTQPQDVSVFEQADALLSVVPDGSGPFTFQWVRGGVALPEATNSTCTLTNLQWAESGSQIYCVISRLNNSPPRAATSRTATITVQPQVPVLTNCIAVLEKGQFVFVFSAVAGGHYSVDYTEKLNPPTWTPVAPSQTATNTTVMVMDVLTNQQRFYRVTHFP